MLLCTFLASILGVMIEVCPFRWCHVIFRHYCLLVWTSGTQIDELTFVYSPAYVRRIKTMRAVSLSRSSSSASLDGMPRSGTPVTESQRLRKRVSSMLLGVKGSMLPGNHVGICSKNKDREYKPENPVARLKLLLVRFCQISFVVISDTDRRNRSHRF
jgi:hypothetical protein